MFSNHVELLTSGKHRHKTVVEGKYAYERQDNWFWWRSDLASAFSIIEEQLRPMPEESFGAPITIYNDWPEKLSNTSIFPYLIDYSTGKEPQYKDFYNFVKSWYQSSCAIIFSSQDGCKIIGTGSLVDDKLVATARHNFQDIPIENLYIRFFKYDVKAVENGWLYVKEQYLDMPVTEKYLAEGGLDAGYLKFPALVNSALFASYGKVLPILNSGPTRKPLSEGQYGMFHFAGGKYLQISIGEINLPAQGMALTDNIAIQAGPGASGATVIWQGFGKVYGVGISIYRINDRGWIDRRLISFSEFNQPSWIDKISAPYHFDPNFCLITTAMLHENSQEFISWHTWSGQYLSSRDRPTHPDRPQYNLQDPTRHSNHHIIPIADLIYLWTYFHTLDAESKNVLSKEIDKDFEPILISQLNALQSEIETFYPGERKQHWDRRHEEILNSLNDKKKNELASRVEKELLCRYNEFFKLFMYLLNVPLKVYSPAKNFDAYKNQFAWSYWNLFQGWSSAYRSDDPKGQEDDSEKNKPLGFNSDIWECLKERQNGLFFQIKDLKKVPINRKSDAIQIENSILNKIKHLATVWYELPPNNKQRIHPFDSNEWQKVGQKEGNDVYKLKER